MGRISQLYWFFQLSVDPEIKNLKKEEPRTDKNIANQSRPVTPEVSYANICSNKTKQQMAISTRRKLPRCQINHLTTKPQIGGTGFSVREIRKIA
ncbi:hypothetical protein TNCV_1347501 [Trichonephila clavipes]|nr:hypothetical protein TNCV_1347501 [Trichonephila clavipes]